MLRRWTNQLQDRGDEIDKTAVIGAGKHEGKSGISTATGRGGKLDADHDTSAGNTGDL